MRRKLVVNAVAVNREGQGVHASLHQFFGKLCLSRLWQDGIFHTGICNTWVFPAASLKSASEIVRWTYCHGAHVIIICLLECHVASSRFFFFRSGSSYALKRGRKNNCYCSAFFNRFGFWCDSSDVLQLPLALLVWSFERKCYIITNYCEKFTLQRFYFFSWSS